MKADSNTQATRQGHRRTPLGGERGPAALPGLPPDDAGLSQEVVQSCGAAMVLLPATIVNNLHMH